MGVRKFDIQFFADDFLTLLDLKNSLEPGDAAIAGVAEVIAEENEILNDIPFARGNLLTGDVSYVRSAMPKSQIRKINDGIEASTSKKTPKTETCIELTSRGVVDMSELDIAPDAAKYLMTENKPHIAALGEDFAASIFYGKKSNGIVGLASRYGKLSDEDRQVVDFGGTGSKLSSVFCVKWDPQEVTGIYPKNSSAGLKVVPQSNIYYPGENGKQMLAHVTEYKWMVGLKVRDRRFISRVCNIPVGEMDADGMKRLLDTMIICKNRVHKVTQGRVCFYVSPDAYTMLEIAAMNKANLALAYKELQSDTRLITFAGIPIRQNDCQLEPEERVV